MTQAYDVSHLYDESGSAKARHYEALRAAERRRLASEFRRTGQGLYQRALASLGEALAVLADKVTRRPAVGSLACSDC